jgi:hypothetical protein
MTVALISPAKTLRLALIERRYNSNSIPGDGTTTSVLGRSTINLARVHATADGSPWTRTIFFGESFFAYSINDSREACALN